MCASAPARTKGPSVKSFEDLGLSEETCAAVARLGYREPTPVQVQAIPAVLAGSDIIAAAQTGTGKTAAFALPALNDLDHAPHARGPLMLVVTPTRELALQVAETCGEIATCTHHSVVTVVGGLSYKPQISQLRNGCDVLVATPGRLIDLMEQGAVKLNEVRVLVLDEADRMLDMGFLPAVRRIVSECPKKRQTLLFSATIDRSIERNLKALLRDPVAIEIARKGETADNVDQYVVHASAALKPTLLPAVLKRKGAHRVIVFARTRSRADSVCRRLKRAGYAAEAIHSNRTQNQRRRALESFANGEVAIIVATDVLARGIDVEEIDYVINYDLPATPEDYVHRIGRTGRAGAKGFAISFVTPDTEDVLDAIERFIKRDIPKLELEDFDLEEAEAAVVERANLAKAQRDPEVLKAKRELAKKEKSEDKKRQAQAESKKAGKKRTSKAQSRKSRTAQAKPHRKQQAGRTARTKRMPKF